MLVWHFIYRGHLHRDNGTTMEYLRKIGWGDWEWCYVKGFEARKIRRVIDARRALKTRYPNAEQQRCDYSKNCGREGQEGNARNGE